MTVHAASTAESPVVPRATRFVIVRFFCVSGLATARVPWTSAPMAGSSGMSTRMVGLTIQLPRLIDVDRAAQAIELNDDGQPHRRLARRDGDDEDGEDLPLEVGQAMGEGNAVAVHGVEHQLVCPEHGDRRA